MSFLQNAAKTASRINVQVIRPLSLSASVNAPERFGSVGESGWKWEKGGVGMGGKTREVGAEAKPTVGKGKEYQAPEFFKYNNYSYFDVEVEMAKQRVEQPKSGLTEFW